MLRMLDTGDIEFLRSQPGFTPSMATKLRAQRTQIFRGYLKSLESDFARVCSAIKLVMWHSNHDRPELAEALIRQQITFACTMLMVRVRVQLYSLGICGVDVTELVKLFDSMRLRAGAPWCRARPAWRPKQPPRSKPLQQCLSFFPTAETVFRPP